MSKTTDDLNFSKSMAELEEIVAWFESGDVDLDKALERFERGMVLTDKLKKYLEHVENKVEVIKHKFDSAKLMPTDSKSADKELEDSEEDTETKATDDALNLF